LSLKDGYLPADQLLDIPLSQAGLVRMMLHDGRQITRLRAPVIADILEPTL